jgi:hypothetical protein
MRKMPWSLVFVSASFVALAVLALLPQPQVVGTEGTAQTDALAPLPPPPSALRPVQMRTVKTAALTQALHLKMQVLDQDGAPIPGVQISCDRLTAFSIGHIFDAQSDAQGSFHSNELVEGTYVVQISHPEFLAVEPLELHLPLDAASVHELRLQRGCVVEGQLFGGDGIPRNHGSLVLKKHGEAQVFEIKPDAEGAFRFPAVSEGQWDISWFTNQQLQQDPRLSHTLLCQPGQNSKLQITIPTTDLRALSDGKTVDVGIQELPNRNTDSPASEL